MSQLLSFFCKQLKQAISTNHSMPVFEPYSLTMHPLVFFAISRCANVAAKDKHHLITNWKEQHEPNDH